RTGSRRQDSSPGSPTSVPFHPDAALVKRDVLQPIALLAGDILCETRVIETVAADQAPIFVDAARDVEFGALAFDKADRARKGRARNRLNNIGLGDVVEGHGGPSAVCPRIRLSAPRLQTPFLPAAETAGFQKTAGHWSRRRIANNCRRTRAR